MARLGKRVLRHFGIELKRCAPVSLFRRPVHYLHIGKNAGTQIGHVIKQVNASQREIEMIKHGHGAVLRSLPDDEIYFFSIRNPLARFKSGFYSRKRMGQPRLNNPWSVHQARVFAEFEHANDLAEALFSAGKRGQKAMSAMLSIGHIGNGQIDWFKKGGDIFELRPPVWIVRQEHLYSDIVVLLRRLGLNQSVTLTTDPVAAHANDYSGTPDFSETAIENLRRWHSPDFQFSKICELWLEAQEEKGAAAE